MKNTDLAVTLKQELDALRPIAPEQEAKIWQKFRFDWNYHSNNIEGNSLTFGETKSLLLHNITAQGKPLKDHLEITGHNEAINALTSFIKGDEPLTESFIRGLHQMLLRERYQSKAITPEGTPTTTWIEVGQYKTTANHVKTVTGEVFYFAEPIDVPDKMRKLVDFINAFRTNDEAAPLSLAAKVHYDFVLIHPFDDGNGRMARMLMNLVLIKYGFPPAIIKTEDKSNYFAALQQADGGQFEVFEEYIAACVSASLKIMLAGARGESMEEADEQDLQIKMLARMLEEKAEKVAAMRTEESIDALLDGGINKLAIALDSAIRKFSILYEGAHGFIDNSPVNFVSGFRSLEAQLMNFKATATQPIVYVGLNAFFSKLKSQGARSTLFKHQWNLSFTFHETFYEVAISPVGGVLKKSYDETISNEEIDSIVSQLINAHIVAIEQAAGVRLDLR